MNSQLWWFAARASGIVSWALVAASVLWGLALSTRVLGRRVRPNWLLDLHRFLGALSVVFTGVHVGALMLDTYTDFGPTDVLVPFASSWRPSAVAWGVAGMYLLLAVQLTSLARRRLSKRVWRAVHFASFPLFGAATVHGITAGSDAANPLLKSSYYVVSLVVVWMTVWRIHTASRDAAAPRRSPVGQTSAARTGLPIHGEPSPQLARHELRRSPDPASTNPAAPAVDPSQQPPQPQLPHRADFASV